MTNIPSITLNDNVSIPILGFGVYLIPSDGSTYKAVREALDFGIRHIDAAAAYFNEREVGKAIRESGIDREEIFLTSKLWVQDFGFDLALKGVDASLKKLGLDYMDLYLLHHPYGDVPGAWKALEAARAAGKIRSIGVSNMTPKIWNEFVPQFDSLPSVNQVEYNPLYQQKPLRELLTKNNVALESWGPLGQGNPELLSSPVIADIASAHGKQPGQVILRFEVQENVIVFPKSTKPERIKSNMDIFDFSLADEEMDRIRAMDTGKGRWNPEDPGVADILRNYDVHADD